MTSVFKSDSSGRWANQPLSPAGVALADVGTGLCLHPLADSPVPPTHSCIVPFSADARAAGWALLAAPGSPVRVNGRSLTLGIHALRDRDEVALGAHRVFFSTEELARVVPFPGLAQPAFCPRCKQKIEPGVPAVSCPGCRAWHHQTEKFPCWSYAPTCALCQAQSTALDAGYTWTPEEL
jgi:hypothetical protein